MCARVILFPFLLLSTVSFGQQPKLVLPVGHTGDINYIQFSPDNKLILTASEDGTAKLWEVKSGYLLHDLKGHALWLDMATFSPDGKKILTVSNDNTVKLWDTRTGKLISTLKGKTKLGDLGNGGIWNYGSFSPDSKYVVTASSAEQDKNISRIWETGTGRLVRTFPSDNESMIPPVFSTDGKFIILSAGKNTTGTWDIKSGKQTAKINGYVQENDSAGFSPDRKYTVTREKMKISLLEDLTKVYLRTATGSEVKLITEEPGSPMPFTFSSNSKMLATVTGDQAVKIWEIPSGRLLVTLSGHMSPAYQASFSEDGKFIISHFYDSSMICWQLSTGKPLPGYRANIYTVNTENQRSGEEDSIVSKWSEREIIKLKKKAALAAAYYETAEISRDGKYVITAEGTWESVARLWDAATGKLLRTVKGHTGVVTSVHFSHDGQMFITAASDDTARIWETKTGKLLRKLDGHQTGVRSAAFSPDAKQAVTTAGDNSISLWDTRSGKLKYTFFQVDSIDYFGSIRSGYYQSSRNCARLLHYVTDELKVISFEQLDVKYNRPDKVLEAIGGSDPAMIKSYQKAWEKRVRKLGIDTTAFRDGYSVPEADFVNRDSIEQEQKAETLILHIKGQDNAYPLDRFNVWVNESPLFGQRGISIRRKNSNSLDTSFTIKLSLGENRIETSITNMNGTESYRMPLVVNYTPEIRQKETLRFIGIGIDKFADPTHNLQYSSKDIRDLSVKLKEKYKDDIIIDTLFNENVTISNVKALKQKLQQTSVNDKVIISYSGHGLLSKEYDYYLSTYNINFDKPEENGLPYDELENLLDSIPARKKLMLIDACHSGEVDKEEITQYKASEDSLRKQGTKGGELRYTGKTQVGMKNSFELMQSLFVNVGKSTGATIISAAAGTQFALERGDLKNGVFTYSILEAMDKNPTMKISELKKTVGERVEQLTNGLQKPTSRNETIAVDWSLW